MNATQNQVFEICTGSTRTRTFWAHCVFYSAWPHRESHRSIIREHANWNCGKRVYAVLCPLTYQCFCLP